MKKIAITQRLIKNKDYFEIREALDINYCKFMKACGFLPIIIPYEVNFKEYFKNIKLDGLILSGGNDLGVCNKNALSIKRDNFEKKLLKYCINFNIPVFGTCRGMQIIANFFKSTFKKIEGEVGTRDKLIFLKKSNFIKSLDYSKKVNSYHNFKIDRLGKDLISVAKNKRGVIKVIEHKRYKIFGQMWHCEREKKFLQNDIRIFQEFFK